MKHKGEIIEKAVRKSGVKLTVLAKRLKKSRGYLYYLFQTRDVSYEEAMKIGRFISYDFSEEYDDIIKNPVIPKNRRAKNTVDFWKTKYITLLEKHNEMIENRKKRRSRKK